ncbi:hypothetical protein NW760_015003 [Fusarium oxysporum]|nr:hypothetical protein NW769_015182 [Fusarium oxysporum]KAJ4213662.1 hypothetical protein NW760_015003 [Fusarium oxysporum]
MSNFGHASPRARSIHRTNVTLLNAIHASYLHSKPYQLDARTSVVVNAWHTSSQAGPIVDTLLGEKVWEHARRRLENNCILLQSLHPSTPSLFIPFLDTLPFAVPSSILTSLRALQPFLYCVTPHNPSTSRHAALALTLDMTPEGRVSNASLSMPAKGIDITSGLLGIAPEVGYRAFDVFYYLLTSVSTQAERDFLSLKPASHYSILAASGTYQPSSHLAAADDGAAADDFRQAIREIGIKGSTQRKLIATLAGLLTLGNTLDQNVPRSDVVEVCEEASIMFGMEPEVLVNLSHSDRRAFMSKVYEALINWVIVKANVAIASQTVHPRRGTESPLTAGAGDESIRIIIIDMPDSSFGRVVAMETNFDESFGVNAEAIEDGISTSSVDPLVWKDTKAMLDSSWYRKIMVAKSAAEETCEERQQSVMDSIIFLAEDDSFLKIILPYETSTTPGLHVLDLRDALDSCRVWYHLCLYPGSNTMPGSLASPLLTAPWSPSDVSVQLVSWRLRDWANRSFTNPAYTVDFGIDEFLQRYSVIHSYLSSKDDICNWALERGWHNTNVAVGQERVWMSEEAWQQAEGMLDMKLALIRQQRSQSQLGFRNELFPSPRPVSVFSSGYGSRDHFLLGTYLDREGNIPVTGGQLGTKEPLIEISPTDAPQNHTILVSKDPELAKTTRIETKHVDMSRRLWVCFVWALTFWIPSPLLLHLGRMTRPDVRQAWREKLALFSIIIFLNALILFWMIGLGKLLCPNSDKAWNRKEVATHQGEDDFWVSIHGKVYDISDFWKRQHSDTAIETTTANMQPLAGYDMDEYFVPPLNMACKGLGIAETTRLRANTTAEYTTALHTSGYYCLDSKSALSKDDWYWTNFEPGIKEYYHGELVYSDSKFKGEAEQGRMWAKYGNKIYDLTNYFYTQSLYKNDAKYKFLNERVTKLWEDNPGKNIKEELDIILEDSSTNKTKHDNIVASWRCIQAISYKGISDFRESAKCQVNNWLLLAFTVMVCAIILVKFLAALRFGSKRRPSPQDKFVICQIPAYTEEEESLRRAIDSLTCLKYDNKRKLMCLICDGIAVGQGNDRPTSKLVLEILGSDPKLDPPARAFKSIGSGSDQLNYGKVYSGLYECDGNIVPYIVIVKVGKESEQTRPKPGNRGKRDSQLLLLSFLNRVYHDSPMNPLELDMFHHINDVIGVDPRMYEFLLMVDADTAVQEDALNHLVAACANNTKIAGICGETRLENDEKSWWTMIQIYEYFISHNLAKAFESLFGSVTCLPGCFTMYRLRTFDGKKPLIVSNAVLRDYSVCDVETLHLKNLLSLGEDRYLTTLMIKHFPSMWLKFLPEAQCQTVAPESWKVLLSQRRRWINSTIHNLVELMRLENMCGVCCFSMRVVVFADLFGTIIFPATCVYLVYLMYRVITNTGEFPMISIILLAATYGLQALLFLLKRQWQHIGWMVIYLMALPVYSFFLPLYSFWNQDNFSWGNTRVVIGEKGDKQVVAIDDEGFDPASIPLQRLVDYAVVNSLPNRCYQETLRHSFYSSDPGTSSIRNSYLPGQSTGMLGNQPPIGVDGDSQQRGSWNRLSMMTGGMTSYSGQNDRPKTSFGLNESGRERDTTRTQSGLGLTTPRALGESGLSNDVISASIKWTLGKADLDSITKRQVRAIVEQRLDTDLSGEQLVFCSRELDRQLGEMESSIGAPCTPRSPPPPRKKRGPNRDLQARLAHCEKLLEECEAAHKQQPPSSSSSTREPSVGPKPTVPGKLVPGDGVVNFTDSPRWAALHEELGAMHELVDVDRSKVSPPPPDDSLNDDGLLPDADTESDFRFLPSQIFHLWKVFLNRVHPVTKIIHAPSTQLHVVEAACTSGSGLSARTQALLFSIYNAALFTLSNDECLEFMGRPKRQVAQSCAKALRVHLRRTNFLRSASLTTLQAVVLYLFSLQGHHDTHATWIFSGICVRIAQKMGLHRDGESLGLPPFETEMRRRLWWRIYMLDARCGLKSGLGPSMMPSAGDSKMPTNLNDSEMHPNSTIYFQDRYGPSEMAVSFLIYSMGKFLAESPSVEASVIQHEIDMTTTVPQARANQLAELPKLAKEVENRLTHIMDRFADPSTPNIYELAGHIKAQILSRVRIMASMPPTKLSLSSQPLQPADKLFLVAVRVVEQSVGEYEAMERIGFLWYMKMHFQLDLFAFMVSQLSRQPAGDMVEKAWELVSKVYQYHEELFDASEKSNLALATATTSAWETKHGPIFTRSVHHVQAPAYIQRLGTMVAVDYAALNMASVTLSDVVGDVDGDPAPPWDDLSLAFLDPSGASLQFPGMF